MKTGRLRSFRELLADSTPGPWSYDYGAVNAIVPALYPRDTPKKHNVTTPSPILTRCGDAQPTMKDANVELASLARPMAEAIALAVTKIDQFDKNCAAAEHTDTGEAWDTMHAVRDLLLNAVGAGVREVRKTTIDLIEARKA